MGKSNIHIGTSGWSYKDWKGRFYPEKQKPADYLSYYARHFSVVEINSSFYHQTKESTVEKWLLQVPDDFIFCPKMSRYVSHLKKLHDAGDGIDRFMNVYNRMGGQLGPILVQLPASLLFNEPTVTAFYGFLKKHYAHNLFAMEVRHPSWFSAASLELMKAYGIILVFAQSERFPYHETITSDAHMYIRFHGPQQLYGSSYSDKDLETYARKMAKWSHEGRTIWAFFNNDINGHALENAGRLQQFLKAEMHKK